MLKNNLTKLQKKCCSEIPEELEKNKEVKAEADLYSKILFTIARFTQLFDGEKNKKIRKERLNLLKIALRECVYFTEAMESLKVLPRYEFETDENRQKVTRRIVDVTTFYNYFTDPDIVNSIVTPFYVPNGPRVKLKIINKKRGKGHGSRFYFQEQFFDNSLRQHLLALTHQLALILETCNVPKKSMYYEGIIYPSLERILKEFKGHFLEGMAPSSLRIAITNNQKTFKKKEMYETTIIQEMTKYLGWVEEVNS